MNCAQSLPFSARRMSGWEFLLLVVFLLFAFNAGTWLRYLDIDITINGYSVSSLFLQLTLSFVALWKMRLVGRYEGGVSRRVNLVLWVYLGMSFSLLGAANPINTFLKLFCSAGLVCYGLTLVYLYGLLPLLRAIDVVFAASIILIPLLWVAYPDSLFIDDSSGRVNAIGTFPYAGIFRHKLGSGAFYAVAALRYFYARDLSRKIAFPLFFISVFCLVLSDSSTFALCLVLGVLVQKVLRRPAYEILLMLVVTAASALFLSTDDFFRLTGREADFTGRLPIWIMAMDLFGNKPFFGYGFNSFFAYSYEDLPYEFLKVAEDSFVLTFENSYLSLLVETGVVGFVGCVFLFFIVFRDMVKIGRGGVGGGAAGFLVAGVVMAFVAGFSVTSLMSPLTFSTFLVGVLFGQFLRISLSSRRSLRRTI